MDPAARPPLATREDLARPIGLAMRRPDFAGERIAAGLDPAKRRGLACASVPCACWKALP